MIYKQGILIIAVLLLLTVNVLFTGCELVKNTEVELVTGFTGESVVLPCVCTDLQDKARSLKWEFSKPGPGISHSEIYPEQTGHHRNRVKLVSKTSPGDLSLLISDLTEEDQGRYRCSVQNDNRYLRLSVKGTFIINDCDHALLQCHVPYY